MSDFKELSDSNFHETIKKGNYAVDFWAAWCPPCKLLAPQFEAASKEMKDVVFAKLDVDSNEAISQEYEVTSIPTIIFFKDGKEVGRSIGLINKDEIIKRIKAAIS